MADPGYFVHDSSYVDGSSNARPLRSGGPSLIVHWGPARGTGPETAAAARPVSESAWRSWSSFPASHPAVAEMLLDAPDGALEHGSDFAGSEMPEADEDELVLRLVPGAVRKTACPCGLSRKSEQTRCRTATEPVFTRTAAAADPAPARRAPGVPNARSSI